MSAITDISNSLFTVFFIFIPDWKTCFTTKELEYKFLTKGTKAKKHTTLLYCMRLFWCFSVLVANIICNGLNRLKFLWWTQYWFYTGLNYDQKVFASERKDQSIAP